MKKFLLVLLISLFLTGCNNIDNSYLVDKDKIKPRNEVVPIEEIVEEDILNKEGITIKDRYLTPMGFDRIEVEENSFGEFLRNQKLKPYGEKVLYFDGREKNKGNVYDSVFDVDIGNRDLHQCADAIMLLRAEYLYAQEKYENIKFNFVSGFMAEYKKWMEGNRIKVDGNAVNYYKATDYSNTYETFRKYMDMVFAYSGTLSLEQELQTADIEDMKIGDVFIVGGSPGHAVIVVDMAEDHNGNKVFMLAQSYMPAQETQLLINPNDKSISPWYSLKGAKKLITPEWNFDLENLKTWP